MIQVDIVCKTLQIVPTMIFLEETKVFKSLSVKEWMFACVEIKTKHATRDGNKFLPCFYRIPK